MEIIYFSANLKFPIEGKEQLMKEIHAFQMTAKDAPFEMVTLPLPELDEGDSLVEVAGCGVCHTDLSFWHHGVPTRKKPPLVLGHEISGTVIKGPFSLVSKPVIVPAVLPCGECDLCKTGRSNICQAQKMPGNDFNGGFASHVIVPSRLLVKVPEIALLKYSLAELAVIADAVTTPYQAMQKSHLEKGDFAIIIGVGGIGIYGVQLAKTFGANVLAIDIAPERLDQLSEIGDIRTLNSKGLDIKEIKNRVKSVCKEMGAPNYGWQIFEMSGTKAGQELALALLGYAGTLSVVGFTMDKLEFRLSNLMAFDAQVIGTWGCRPELYCQVIDIVSGSSMHGETGFTLKPFTETRPMSEINNVFQQMLNGELTKRVVLKPDFN